MEELKNNNRVIFSKPLLLGTSPVTDLFRVKICKAFYWQHGRPQFTKQGQSLNAIYPMEHKRLTEA